MTNTTSKKPRKQRKKLYDEPLHQRRKHIHAPLSKDLRKAHKRKTVAVRQGDEVKIVRGSKKTSGPVEVVDLKSAKIFIKGHTQKRNDGSEVMQPVDASNVIVTKIDTEDKRRFGNAPKKD